MRRTPTTPTSPMTARWLGSTSRFTRATSFARSASKPEKTDAEG
jgi:hypothetical protein